MVQHETEINKKTSGIDSHFNPENAHEFLIALTEKDKKVLKLGPSSEHITELLEKKGCSVTNIEIDTKFVKRTKNFTDKISVEDLEKLNLNDILKYEKYDVILINEVLEYIRNPTELLRSLKDFLKENGLIVCSVSNIAHGNIRLQLLDGEFNCKKIGLLNENQIRFFTLKTILSMLDHSGFSITKLHRVKAEILNGDSSNLKPYTVPNELLKSILRDRESTTLKFVFAAKPSEYKKGNIDWNNEFPTNLTIDDLKNRLQPLSEFELLKKQEGDLVDKYTKALELLKIEKNSIIDELIRRNDIIKSINAELEEYVAELQKTILEIHQSFVFRVLRKYDNSIGKLIPFKPKKYLKTVSQSLEEKKSIIRQALANPLEKKDIICFPIINWNYRYQRPQHILSLFAKNGHRVFYLTQNLRKQKFSYEIKPLEKNIFQIDFSTPFFFDIYKDELTPTLIQTLSKTMEELQNELKIDAFCFVQFPTWYKLVLEFQKLFGFKIIFDVLDDFSAFPNIKKNITQNEEELLKHSDLVISTSNSILQKTQKFSNNTLFLPNACDFKHFSNPISENVLKNFNKPIIGYFGSIAEWFDTDLVEYIAKKRPQWTFVFIGHTYGSDISKLETLENVHFLGERNYLQLPNYLQSFDACLIPFKINSLTESTHPVKIYEYFSAGKPVVSTNLTELSSMSDICYIADSKEDFLLKLDAAVSENDDGTIQKRIKFASQNTWQNRFERLYHKLSEIDSLNLNNHN